MTSAHTGEVTFTLNGQALRLVYDWRALAEVKSQVEEEVLTNLLKATPAQLVALLLIGLRRNHPDVTAEAIYEASPPVAEAASAIDKALLYAHWGPEEAKKILDQVNTLRSQLEAETNPATP